MYFKQFDLFQFPHMLDRQFVVIVIKKESRPIKDTPGTVLKTIDYK